MIISFGRISVLVFIGLFLVPVVSSGMTDNTGKLMAEGEVLFELGKIEDARLIFQRVINEDPDNLKAQSYLRQISGINDQFSAARQPDGEKSILTFFPQESGQAVVNVSSTPGDFNDETPQELEQNPEPFQGHEDLMVPKPFEEQISGEDQEEQIGNKIPRSPRLRVHYFYRQGLEAFESGSYAEAIRAFEEVQKIKTDYRRADYYRREAWDRIASEQFTGEQGAQAGEERMEEKECHEAYSRGKEYMRYGKFVAAVGEFQKVLDSDPNHQGAQDLLGKARLRLEKTAFEDEVAAAEKLAEEEAALRALSREEEEMAVRQAYHEGEQFFKEKEFESSRRKFSEVEEKRGGYRRAGFYLRKIDRELWEKKESERVNFEEEAIAKYTLGPDDVVRVVVRNHPEFDFVAKVEENGELIIPLTNEIIEASGLTREELAENIRQYLTAFIDNPFVNVFITEYNSKKYYVLLPDGGGSEFIMDKASMTLWDVMFRAGIPELDKAALRRIQVITPHKTHPTHRWINVYAMLYEGKMEDNIRIEPGTIIYYPMLAIDKFTMTLKAITRPLRAMSDFGDDWEDWDNFRKEYLR